MTDFLSDPDLGMSISIGEYERLFLTKNVEREQRSVDEIDSAIIAAESLKKSIESDKEE